MKINLSPIRMDVDPILVIKSGNTVTVNNVLYDFSRMQDGDILPVGAIEGNAFGAYTKVTMTGEELEFTLLFPIPANFSPEQAFPEPLLDVPDGVVALPQPLPVQKEGEE
ncbi:hypothetical protein [Pseudomonas sp. B26(2017)]|uniref:hypothetical protein n=1 Tax=Pseudomonas sp. B26(2017) TaxID=1981732 RepID=UPI000A1D7239|nr:hypothetical protein [Pseudomonas sp. B26(2017)]